MGRIGPCLCGDTECPSCGPLINLDYEGPDYSAPDTWRCEACERLVDAGQTLCSTCEAEAKRLIHTWEERA